jgi:hypothetical protein
MGSKRAAAYAGAKGLLAQRRVLALVAVVFALVVFFATPEGWRRQL